MFTEEPPGAYNVGAGTLRPPVEDSHKGTFPYGSIFYMCQKGELADLQSMVNGALHCRLPCVTCSVRDDLMGATPLHVAAEAGQLEVAEYLISCGVEVSCNDKFQVTPLHLAALRGHAEVCNALLAARALVNAQDVVGDLPIHWAATAGHANVIKVLLRKSSPLNVSNDEGWTPLHRAAYMGQAVATETLLDAGANPSMLTKKKDLPLHLACYTNAIETIEVIIKRGKFDPCARNKHGLTPFGMCFSEDARHILRQYGAEAPTDRVPEPESAGQSRATTKSAGLTACLPGSDGVQQPEAPEEELSRGASTDQGSQCKGLSADKEEEDAHIAAELRRLAVRKKKKQEDFPDPDDPGNDRAAQARAESRFDNSFLAELTSNLDTEVNPYLMMRKTYSPPDGLDRSSSLTRSSSISRQARTSTSTSHDPAVPGRRLSHGSYTLSPRPSTSEVAPVPNKDSGQAQPAVSTRCSRISDTGGPRGRTESSKFAPAPPFIQPQHWGTRPRRNKSVSENGEPQPASFKSVSKPSLAVQPRFTSGNSRVLGEGASTPSDRSSLDGQHKAAAHKGRALEPITSTNSRQHRRSSATNTRVGPHKWEGNTRTDMDTLFVKGKQPSRAGEGPVFVPPSQVSNPNRKFLEKYNLSKMSLFAP